jgi:hypothetical protein
VRDESGPSSGQHRGKRPSPPTRTKVRSAREQFNGGYRHDIIWLIPPGSAAVSPHGTSDTISTSTTGSDSVRRNCIHIPAACKSATAAMQPLRAVLDRPVLTNAIRASQSETRIIPSARGSHVSECSLPDDRSIGQMLALADQISTKTNTHIWQKVASHKPVSRFSTRACKAHA